MADATIEILLRSSFESTGFEEAKKKTEEIAKIVEDEMGEGAGGGFLGDFDVDISDEDFPTPAANKFSEVLQQISENLREMARAADRAGKHDLAERYRREAQQARGLANAHKDLGKLTESELIKRFTKVGSTLDEMADDLEHAAAQMRKFQAEAAKGHETATAEELEITANRAEKLARKYRELEIAQRRLTEVSVSEKISEQFQDVDDIGQFEDKLRSLRQEYINARDAAILAGDEAGAVGNADNISQVEDMHKRLFGMRKDYRQLGQEAGLLGNILSHPFNQLGFAMFVTQSTLRNLIGTWNQLKDAIEKGIETKSIIDAGKIAAASLGGNFVEINAALLAVSGGMIDQQDLIKEYVKLAYSANPTLADYAEQIVKIALGYAEITSEDPTEVLSSITDALIKGEASSADLAPGLIDLSGATAKMALEANELGRELTTLERSNIVLEELLAQSEGVVEAAENFDSAGEDYAKTGLTISRVFSGIGALLDETFGKGSKDIDLTKEFMDDLVEVSKSGIKPVSDFANVVLLLLSASQIGHAMQEGSTDVAEAVEILKNASSELQLADIEPIVDPDKITSSLEYILSDERQFFLQREKLREQYRETIDKLIEDEKEDEQKIENDKDREILEADEKFFEDKEDLYEKHMDRLAELGADYNDKLIKIDDNYNLRDRRLVEDAQYRREDQDTKHKKKLEDIEEDHQKKIRDILRKFELAKLDALIDRDARALHQAELQRDEELRKAQEDAEKKREDENESNDERLKDLEKDLARRRQRLAEDAEIQRKEAEKAYKKQQEEEEKRYNDRLKDLKDEYKKQLQEIEKEYKKQLKELKKQYDDQEEALKEGLKDQEEDLTDSYKEKELITAAGEALKNQEHLEGLLTQTTDLGTQLQIMRDMWTNYYDFLADISDGQYTDPSQIPDYEDPGGDDDDDKPPPQPVPKIIDVTNPDAQIQEGGWCNYDGWVGWKARNLDGSLYQCTVNNKWQMINPGTAGEMGSNVQNNGSKNVNQSQPQLVKPGNFFGSNSVQPGQEYVYEDVPGNGSGRIQATLVLEGDSALKELIEESFSDFFIEVMN